MTRSRTRPPAPVVGEVRCGRGLDRRENLDDLPRLFADCARLRCDRASDPADTLPHEVVRPVLLAQLAASAAARDATGCATILAGLAPMWATLPGGINDARVELPGLRHHTAGLGGSGQRGVAVSVAAWIEEVLARVPRCPDTDYCPACADGLPCPRDAWAKTSPRWS